MTKDDILGRLVIEHCVHEAKGLDITGLKTVNRFKSNNDHITANLLNDVILVDEITHVRDGLKWFNYVCE